MGLQSYVRIAGSDVYSTGRLYNYRGLRLNEDLYQMPDATTTL